MQEDRTLKVKRTKGTQKDMEMSGNTSLKSALRNGLKKSKLSLTSNFRAYMTC